MVRCFECMEEYEETYSKCPYCGEERRWIQQGKEYLNPGTKLQNRYIVGKLGKSGRQILYILAGMLYFKEKY